MEYTFLLILRTYTSNLHLHTSTAPIKLTQDYSAGQSLVVIYLYTTLKPDKLKPDKCVAHYPKKNLG